MGVVWLSMWSGLVALVVFLVSGDNRIVVRQHRSRQKHVAKLGWGCVGDGRRRGLASLITPLPKFILFFLRFIHYHFFPHLPEKFYVTHVRT